MGGTYHVWGDAVGCLRGIRKSGSVFREAASCWSFRPGFEEALHVFSSMSCVCLLEKGDAQFLVCRHLLRTRITCWRATARDPEVDLYRASWRATYPGWRIGTS